jgi:hypothetical protein
LFVRNTVKLVDIDPVPTRRTHRNPTEHRVSTSPRQGTAVLVTGYLLEQKITEERGRKEARENNNYMQKAKRKINKVRRDFNSEDICFKKSTQKQQKGRGKNGTISSPSSSTAGDGVVISLVET